MDNVYCIVTSNGELYHYGVKGMKWGVRRDARLLANSRRNKKVRAAREAYRLGRATKDSRDRMIESARQEKKKFLSETKERYKNAKSDRERMRIDREIADKTVKEVSNVAIKRGAYTANAIFGGLNAASVGLTTASLVTLNPAFAGAALASAAVSVAAETGYRYAIQLGLDKVS